MTKSQYTCKICEQVSDDKLCFECYCAVCGNELECGYCMDCEQTVDDDKEEEDEHD